MPTPVPRFVVLGGPVPTALRDALDGALDLAETAELPGDAAGVLVHRSDDLLPAVRRFREGGARQPIFGLSEAPVEVAERIRWVREGADDLLELASDVEKLSTRLKTAASQTAGSGTATSTAARIDRWLRATARYLASRDQLLANLGPGARGRFLDCVFLRDQVLRASDPDSPTDPFGQRRGSEREQLAWPVRMSAPVSAAAELQNVGADGACVGLPFAPGPGEHIHVDIEGDEVAGRLELEVRWQRRVARGRWQVGAFGIACTLSRGA